MTTEKFIQMHIPCKECLVAPICEDKKIIDRENKKHDLYSFMLSLRRWDQTKKTYRKGLIEAWVNMGWDIFSVMREADKDPGNIESMYPEFMSLLCEISSITTWITNSASWREGKKFDFDKIEIELMVKKLLRYI